MFLLPGSLCRHLWGQNQRRQFVCGNRHTQDGPAMHIHSIGFPQLCLLPDSKCISKEVDLTPLRSLRSLLVGMSTYSHCLKLWSLEKPTAVRKVSCCNQEVEPLPVNTQSRLYRSSSCSRTTAETPSMFYLTCRIAKCGPETHTQDSYQGAGPASPCFPGTSGLLISPLLAPSLIHNSGHSH